MLLNRYNLSKLKKSNCYIYIAIANYCWVIKLGELKNDQKYFAKQVRKSCKPPKIIPTIPKLFNQCVHSWRGFAESIVQVVLFTILWFNWSVKKHCLAKVLLAIWETCLHEDNYNSIKLTIITIIIIPTNLVTNLVCFYPLFLLSYKPRTRIWFSASCWSGNEKYFCFLLIASRDLLQSHTEFNRLL